MLKRLIRSGFRYFSDGKKFVIRFYKIKRYGVSGLLRNAPHSFQILASYAKSCGITLEIPYPPKKLKLNGETNYIWAAPEQTVWMPAPILDLNDKNSEYWRYALDFLAHEIGHLQDKKKRNCPFSTVGKWCLCPSWEIYAQKRGMEILKNLGILPEQKILDHITNHFSKHYIVDILKENKKCAKNLMEGKCLYLTWSETLQIIDHGI